MTFIAWWTWGWISPRRFSPSFLVQTMATMQIVLWPTKKGGTDSNTVLLYCLNAIPYGGAGQEPMPLRTVASGPKDPAGDGSGVARVTGRVVAPPTAGCLPLLYRSVWMASTSSHSPGRGRLQPSLRMSRTQRESWSKLPSGSTCAWSVEL